MVVQFKLTPLLVNVEGVCQLYSTVVLTARYHPIAVLPCSHHDGDWPDLLVLSCVRKCCAWGGCITTCGKDIFVAYMIILT